MFRSVDFFFFVEGCHCVLLLTPNFPAFISEIMLLAFDSVNKNHADLDVSSTAAKRSRVFKACEVCRGQRSDATGTLLVGAAGGFVEQPLATTGKPDRQGYCLMCRWPSLLTRICLPQRSPAKIAQTILQKIFPHLQVDELKELSGLSREALLERINKTALFLLLTGELPGLRHHQLLVPRWVGKCSRRSFVRLW